jgi:flagellar capping protein FliD
MSRKNCEIQRKNGTAIFTFTQPTSDFFPGARNFTPKTKVSFTTPSSIGGTRSFTDNSTSDKFEKIVEAVAGFFNDIIEDVDIINDSDFSNIISLINELGPEFLKIKNFLLDTITVANFWKICTNTTKELIDKLNNLKNEYDDLQNEYNILKDEYDELEEKYLMLEEQCGEMKNMTNGFTNLIFNTTVEIEMDKVYLLYQHFFGYPDNGIWDKDKVNMISKHLYGY